MQLHTILSAAALVAAVGALPTDIVSQGPPNVLSSSQSIHDIPQVIPGTKPIVFIPLGWRNDTSPSPSPLVLHLRTGEITLQIPSEMQREVWRSMLPCGSMSG